MRTKAAPYSLCTAWVYIEQFRQRWIIQVPTFLISTKPCCSLVITSKSLIVASSWNKKSIFPIEVYDYINNTIINNNCLVLLKDFYNIIYTCINKGIT